MSCLYCGKFNLNEHNEYYRRQHLEKITWLKKCTNYPTCKEIVWTYNLGTNFTIRHKESQINYINRLFLLELRRYNYGINDQTFIAAKNFLKGSKK